MTDLQRVLDVTEGVTGAARGRRDGLLEEQVGDVDGETLCATATIGTAQLAELASAVGAGELLAWQVRTGELFFQVEVEASTLITVVGEPRAGATTLRRALERR